MNFSSRVFLFVRICPIGPGGSRFADYTPMGAAATSFVESSVPPAAGLP